MAGSHEVRGSIPLSSTTENSKRVDLRINPFFVWYDIFKLEKQAMPVLTGMACSFFLLAQVHLISDLKIHILLVGFERFVRVG